MDASSLVLIGTGLTLIVTIVGWIVTYRLQKQILDRQINADEDAESRKLIIPPTIESLRAYKAWLEESPLILDPVRPMSDLEKSNRRLEWISQIWKHQAVIVSQLDHVRDEDLVRMIQDYLLTIGEAVRTNQPLDANNLGLEVSKISIRIDKLIADIAYRQKLSE